MVAFEVEQELMQCGAWEIANWVERQQQRTDDRVIATAHLTNPVQRALAYPLLAEDLTLPCNSQIGVMPHVEKIHGYVEFGVTKTIAKFSEHRCRTEYLEKPSGDTAKWFIWLNILHMDFVFKTNFLPTSDF